MMSEHDRMGPLGGQDDRGARGMGLGSLSGHAVDTERAVQQQAARIKCDDYHTGPYGALDTSALAVAASQSRSLADPTGKVSHW